MKIKNKIKHLFRKENLINVFATILTISVILFATIYSVAKSANDLKNLDFSEIYASFEKLNEGTTDLSFITNPISNGSPTTLINKLSEAEVDIVENNTISYDKFIKDSISVGASFSLTEYEVGILWNRIYNDHPDKLNSYIYEVTIAKLDNGYTLKTIASIDLSLAYDKAKLGDGIRLSTQRVYVTNYLKVQDENNEYTKVVYNNLNESESNKISSYLSGSLICDLDTYIPSLLVSLIQDLSTKTSLSAVISDSLIEFNI